MKALIDCDKTIENLIQIPYDFYKGLPYVLGHYFSVNATCNIDVDKNLFDNIKRYLDNATDIDTYIVFKGVGCDVDKLNLVPSVVDGKRFVRIRKKDEN